jgi:3-hydroxyisobutyrate dehydrogenase-like beta-hydroxyacid dehydrogenase
MAGHLMTNMQKTQQQMNNKLHIAILGLGEAGSIFANDLAAMGLAVSGWDPNPKIALHKNIRFAANNADAAKDADIILSVNLSAVSESVAREVLPMLNNEKIYAEMNTSSPQQKIAIENLLKSTGVRFADVAIMAPVPPKGIKTPFLISGNGAAALKEKLYNYNLNITLLSDKTGDASTRKLLRSIVYKGVAAVICEAVEAGKAFGLETYIREQISSVIGGNDALIDRFVEGSKTHAGRRIHEMEAVEEMLREKNLQALMSTAARQNLVSMLHSKH